MTTTGSDTSAASLLGPAIRVSVKRTMGQICDREPKFAEKPGDTGGEGISAMIRCEGDMAFTLVLSLPRGVVPCMTKTFTGVPIHWDAEILDDVVGELLNVLAGDVVAELSHQGIVVQMGLPQIDRTLDPARAVPEGIVVEEVGLLGNEGNYSVRVVTQRDEV